MLDFETVAPALVALLDPLRTLGIVTRVPANLPQSTGQANDAVASIVVLLEDVTPIDRGNIQGPWARRYQIGYQCRAAQLFGEAGLYRLPVHLDRLVNNQAVPGLGVLRFERFTVTSRAREYWEAVASFSAVRFDP
jgi:hypothetical protein